MRKILLTLGISINIFTLAFAFATNFSTIVILIFCLSVLMIIYGIFLKSRKMLIILTTSLVVLFTLLIGFNIFLYHFGESDNVTYNEDALIILGAGVNGETPSLMLEDRLNAALEYYSRSPNVMIVVSGGQGPHEDITEALAMERYLVEGCVPIEKIIKEEKATTTRENITFSKQLLDQYFDKPYKVAIVTNDFHVFRSMIIAENIDLESTHIHAKIPIYSIPANYLRETIAILFQVLFSC